MNRKTSWWMSALVGAAMLLSGCIVTSPGRSGGSNDDDWTCSCIPFFILKSNGTLVTPIFGYADWDQHWCLPLWYCDNGTFYSLPYMQGSCAWHPSATWWFSPVSLSFGEYSRWDAKHNNNGIVLLGIAGWDWTDYDDYSYHRKGDCEHQWWLWPLVGHALKVAPEQRKDEKQNEVWNRRTTSSMWWLSGLAGWEHDHETLVSSRFYPFYGWKKDAYFWSLLGGCSDTELWATPLVCVNRQKNQLEGGWIFPFGSHERSRDYGEKVAMLNRLVEAEDLKGNVNAKTNQPPKLPAPHCSSDTAWFFLWDDNSSIASFGWNDYVAQTNKCLVEFRRKIGNKLLFDYQSTRGRRYNFEAEEKLVKEEKTTVNLLGALYQYEFRQNLRNTKVYKNHRVLWRLWNWEETDMGFYFDLFYIPICRP